MIDDAVRVIRRTHATGSDRRATRQRNVTNVTFNVGRCVVTELRALRKQAIGKFKLPVLHYLSVDETTRELITC